MTEVAINDGEGVLDGSIHHPPIRVLDEGGGNGGEEMRKPCAGDRKEMDFVADSDASTDEDDHEGLSAANQMMPEVDQMDDDITFYEIGDSNKTQKDVGVTKPVDEVIGMDMQLNISSNPTHTVLDRFDRDCEVNMPHRCPEDYPIREGVNRMNYRRLNYLGSQEPGEFSQANAMHVVDKLLFDDDIGLSQETSTVKVIGTTSAPHLSAQVAKCLVNMADHNCSVGNVRIFDWADSPKDEAGGGFFSKRKEFLSKNSLNALKSKNRLSKHKQIDASGDRESKNLEIYPRRNSLTDSKSMPLPHSLGSCVRPDISEAKTKEQPKYMDTSSSLGFIEQQIETTAVLGGIYGTFDIGPNTQMAAEAIEALFRGPALNDNSIEDSNPLNQISNTGSTKGIRREKASPINVSLPKGSTRSKEIDKNDANNPQKLHEGCKSKMELAQGVSAKAFRHPKRRRTHVLPSGNSNFDNAVTGRLPDLLERAKRKRRSRKLRITTSRLNDVFDNSLAIVSSDRALLKDVVEPNPDKIQQNSLTCRAPMRASYMKGFSNISASREHVRLAKNERSSDRMFARRKKKDMASVCVLFSQHLDQDKIKQQRKILARFGALTASSIIEATHFIADKFTRTKNMLEAIAMGKLVVTSMWLESCGQASCFIDEKRYILRDLKKEKEIGFSMPASLTRASQCPLLQGKMVLITPKVKPNPELVISLVKAARGQPLDRIGKSAMKDQKVSDEFFIISCEEDYKICVPLIKKGMKAFSSELLLNGIVIQKLEFQRYRLFSGSD